MLMTGAPLMIMMMAVTGSTVGMTAKLCKFRVNLIDDLGNNLERAYYLVVQ